MHIYEERATKFEEQGLHALSASIRLHRARGKFVDELRKIDDDAGHEGVREGRGT